MADQDRWTNERERGRWADEDRARRGYDDYGRGAYDEDRTFGAEYDSGDGENRAGQDQDRDYAPSASGRYGQGSYGQGSYGQGGQRGYSGQARYGSQQGHGHGRQSSYGQSGYSQGRYGSQQYRGASYDPRRYDETSYGSQYGGAAQRSYGSDSGRYGGALGYDSGGMRSAPAYGDGDWTPDRHRADGEHRNWMERTGEKIANFFTGDGHRGRGPKNYTRSDDRIREDVNDRLTEDPFINASEIEVAVSSGEVTLTGTVDSREEKRRAEDLADQVSGAKHVQNNLRVQASYSPSTGASTTGSSVGSSTTGSALGSTTDTTTTGKTRSN